MSGCDNLFAPNLQVTEISKEIEFESRIPFYMGKVKNFGHEEAKYAEIEIHVFAAEEHYSQIAISDDYLGTIEPGESKNFKVYFFYLHPMTDISNYEIKFRYE